MSAEVKPGYKLTEVGVIPVDWDASKIYTCCSKITDGTHDTPKPVETGIPFLTAIHVKDNWIDFASSLFLTSTDHADIFRRCNPEKNDVLMVNIGAGVATTALVTVDYEFSLKNVALLKPAFKIITGPFLNYSLAQRKAKIIKDLSFGGAQPFLSLKQIGEILIPLPPSSTEQEAIAEALSDADAHIESLEQLITKKRQIKQGAMQDLLNPLDGWKKVKLGSLGVFLKGSGVKKDESMSGNIPCIRYGEIYTKHKYYIKAFDSWISPEVAATAKRIKSGDILFAGSGETKEEIGKCVAFVGNIEAYAGGDIVIFRPNNANSLFLGCYLNTESVNRQKASRGQGDAVVHIGSNALADIDLIIPPVEEQAVIAAVLFDMDAEIGVLEAKLEKALQLKRGMMHNLLTGKIRLV